MILYKKKSWCLMTTLLLSACHSHTNSAQHSVSDQTIGTASATEVYIDPTKTLFPIANYSQSVDKWLPPDAADYDVTIMDDATQQRYFSALKSHYFGMGAHEQSPWNPEYLTSLLNNQVESERNAALDKFLSRDKENWGENFRIRPAHWKESVRENANTPIGTTYQASRRGITLRETNLRALPTTDTAYSDPRRAGEGYPFDNLQLTSIRPGTPVYVLAESRDKSWQYIQAPTYRGWVQSEDIARVDQKFITEWGTLARKNLGAFINQPVSVQQNGQYYFTARPGTVLPFKENMNSLFVVAVPVAESDGSASIRWVKLNNTQFTAMPWKMTRRNIAVVMKSMIGRPYGWGNYNFNNDCSAELLSLLMPFGIFLPRDSGPQIQSTSRVVDLSEQSLNDRINYIVKQGKPFTTLVYIPGHIMLYIGNTRFRGEEVPMTYMNIWGLRPVNKDSRSIIGGSVFLPLLSSYPENTELNSLAGRAQFKVGFIE